MSLWRSRSRWPLMARPRPSRPVLETAETEPKSEVRRFFVQRQGPLRLDHSSSTRQGTPADPQTDPKGVFKVEDGMIHVSGEEFGCLTTEKEFENYRLTRRVQVGRRRSGPPARTPPATRASCSTASAPTRSGPSRSSARSRRGTAATSTGRRHRDRGRRQGQRRRRQEDEGRREATASGTRSRSSATATRSPTSSTAWSSTRGPRRA